MPFFPLLAGFLRIFSALMIRGKDSCLAPLLFHLLFWVISSSYRPDLPVAGSSLWLMWYLCWALRWLLYDYRSQFLLLTDFADNFRYSFLGLNSKNVCTRFGPSVIRSACSWQCLFSMLLPCRSQAKSWCFLSKSQAPQLVRLAHW